MTPLAKCRKFPWRACDVCEQSEHCKADGRACADQAQFGPVEASAKDGIKPLRTAYEQVQQWQSEYMSDPKPHWGDTISWVSAFAIARKLDEIAAIRLLSQGGGKA